MVGSLDVLVQYFTAFDAIGNTLNLWKRGVIGPTIALEEIGRILRDHTTEINALVARIDAEEKVRPSRLDS